MPEPKIVHLEYEPPYLFAELLDFFRVRQLDGVERIDESSYSRTVCIPKADGDIATGWIRVSDDPPTRSLVLEMSALLKEVENEVARRVSRQFDTGCDPHAVHEVIAGLNEVVPNAAVEGTRLPGAFEVFETASRAILGQQVTVKVACSLARKMVDVFGMRIDTGIQGLDRAFPTTDAILALNDVEDELGSIGVIRSRSRCIAELAELIQAGEVDLGPDCDCEQQIARLLDIKGIGPWTAGYMAMRVMSYTDAFLETDAGIKHALPDHSPTQRLELVENMRPYRSYANISLWNSLSRNSAQ